MSKPTAPRRVSESEALSRSTAMRVTPYKLNLVAELIRNKTADEALAALTFCRRRCAGDVKKVLQSAIANAENNHSLDVDKLVVTRATVGRALVMKRFMARGRGRSTRIEKFFSNLTIVVGERIEKKKAEKPVGEGKKTAAKKTVATKPAAKKTTSKKEAA
jgi:large subunit ribosomal protein L22